MAVAVECGEVHAFRGPQKTECAIDNDDERHEREHGQPRDR